MPVQYNPSDPDTRRNPYPIYQHLQDHDPVHWSPSLQSWIITRYDDVRASVLSKNLSPDRITPFYEASTGERRVLISEMMKYLNLWLVFRDPPEHTRIRRLLNTSFTPSTIKGLAPCIEGTVRFLLSNITRNEPFDFISNFANLLPAYVIMDMLNIDRKDFEKIKSWSDELKLFVGSAQKVDNKYNRAHSGCMNLAAYFRDLIRERRNSIGQDFVSRMIIATDNEEKLEEDELVATCMLILFAGHETTASLIGNSLKALLCHPDQMSSLKKQPSLIGQAVEEFLRYDGPAHSIGRVASADHKLASKDIKKGDRVFAMLGAANRDPRVFDDPQDLNIFRSHNPHLGFSQGPHFCLGATLARLETTIALSEILQETNNISLHADTIEWGDTLVMRGMSRMHISIY